MNTKTLYLFMLLGYFLIPEGRAQNIKVGSTFNRLKYTFQTKVSNKQEMLEKLDRQDIIPIYTDFDKETHTLKKEILLLDGESSSFSIDIQNQENREVEFHISSNLPSDWNVEIRRQALLPDYFSYANVQRPNVNFFGDALPLLIKQENPLSWSVTLKSKEVGRFFIDFKVDKASFGEREVRLQVSNNSDQLIEEIPLIISNKNVPATVFNSVIFNNNSYQMARYANRWLDVGLNNLVLYSFPTLKFDGSGNRVGNIDHGTADSKEFRYVVDFWAKQDRNFLFYWSKRFDRLAPLAEKGGYLKPYTSEWNRAFINMVKSSFEYIKSKNPGISTADILLYVEDEISSGTYPGGVSERVQKIAALLQEIKDKIPEYKVFLTLSMYSFPDDLKIATKYADILVPLIYLPEKLTRNAPGSYRPIKAFQKNLYGAFPGSNRKRIQWLKSDNENVAMDGNAKGQELWSYLVTKGKASNILDFRILPVYAVLLGRAGLSWWAFSDTKGSSWLPFDQQALDYSMVYYKERDNSVYQFWNRDQSEDIIPSIRLYAAREGIKDAKIFRYLIENKSRLGNQEKTEFNGIIDLLSTTLDNSYTQPDPTKYLTVEQYEEVSQTLRRLYVSL